MNARILSRFFPLICLLVLSSTECKQEQSLQDPVEPAAAVETVENKVPLDLSLRLIPGVDDFGSLAVVRLFSRQVLQSEIDRSILGKSEAVEDLVLTIPRSVWEGASFSVTEGNGKSLQPVKDVDIIDLPESERVTISPANIVEAVYQFKNAELSPGRRLTVEIKLQNVTYQSNAVVIGLPPGDEGEKTLQLLELLMVSGKNGELSSASERMIKEYPDNPGGYWYRAIAFENSGDKEQALRTYLKTLEVFKNKKATAGRFSEPPMLLIEKIRELSIQTGGSGDRDLNR